MTSEPCPKCGKTFLYQSYYGGPDNKDIVGIVVHAKKIVRNLFGCPHEALDLDKTCFLNEEEWNRLKNHPKREPQEPIEVPYYPDWR